NGRREKLARPLVRVGIVRSMTERGPQTDVLRWTACVLSAADLRQHLNGHREVLLSGKTIVTPSAVDELKAKGVGLSRLTENQVVGSPSGKWFCVQEKCDPVVDAAVNALRREGVKLSALQAVASNAATWAREVARQLSSGEHVGGVAFCADAALVCCVANKVKGIRAAVVASAAPTPNPFSTIGANLLAVEMPGRTLFEVRQILRTAATSKTARPDTVVNLLAEIEAHAHR